MRLFSIITLLFICFTNCKVNKEVTVNSGCNAEESVFEIEFVPTFEKGYRFVRHNGTNVDELYILITDGSHQCFFKKNNNTEQIKEFDESKMQFLIDSIDNMKKGNFIQSCSGTHYDHPVDSIFFIESNSVKFQYVSTFNTPLSLNDNTIMKMGRLNFNAMKMIYSIYSQR